MVRRNAWGCMPVDNYGGLIESVNGCGGHKELGQAAWTADRHHGMPSLVCLDCRRNRAACDGRAHSAITIEHVSLASRSDGYGISLRKGF